MGVLKLGLLLPCRRTSSHFFGAKAMAMAAGSRPHQETTSVDTSISVVINYHDETKHFFNRYAKGPHGLDWANQPNPFRRYEGSTIVVLEHLPEWPTKSDDPLWPAIFIDSLPPKPLNRLTLSQLLYDSLALSAWKAVGRSTWSLRVNPSSGNLHPTEGYVISDAIEGVAESPFIAHYAPKGHLLEIRADISVDVWKRLSKGLPPGSLLMGFTSIFWRESWKYGERAFRNCGEASGDAVEGCFFHADCCGWPLVKWLATIWLLPHVWYCNHDVGHAIGAATIAAASLGWNSCLLDGFDGEELDRLFGLPQTRVRTDRGPTKGVLHELEHEHADCIMAIFPNGQNIHEKPCDRNLADYVDSLEWKGQMNALSKEHVRWGIIYQAAQVSRKPCVGNIPIAKLMPSPNSMLTSAVYEPLTVRQVVRKRRSAVDMDGAYGMLADVFYQILAKTLPTTGVEAQGAPRQLPFNALPWSAEVHLAIFVHRVVGLEPGIYLLVRNETRIKDLKKATKNEFEWEKPDNCPPSLPLYMLHPGDVQDLATRLSCNQDIAGQGFFSLGMLARFEPALREKGTSMYPRLFWETGLIGQVLYLEAHAFGVSATGIGCFFDDSVHQVLGIKAKEFQSLYHFTIGVPVVDNRILNLPSYPGPPNANF